MDIYEMSSSSSSWIHSEAQLSRDKIYAPSQLISNQYHDYQQEDLNVILDSYGWYINNYMQNYFIKKKVKYKTNKEMCFLTIFFSIYC